MYFFIHVYYNFQWSLNRYSEDFHYVNVCYHTRSRLLPDRSFRPRWFTPSCVRHFIRRFRGSIPKAIYIVCAAQRRRHFNVLVYRVAMQFTSRWWLNCEYTTGIFITFTNNDHIGIINLRNAVFKLCQNYIHDALYPPDILYILNTIVTTIHFVCYVALDNVKWVNFRFRYLFSYVYMDQREWE